MKKVIVHWVEMQTLIVPDECPTDDAYEMDEWLGANREKYVEKNASRDYEIVDVEVVQKGE